MTQRFISQNEISEEVLLDWLQKLEAISCRKINRRGVLAEEELNFSKTEDLLEKIAEDLEYQEGIANAALELYGEGKQGGLQSYFWEVSFESVGALRRQQYLSINLTFETTDPQRGRILFPIMILKCRNSMFKYWEIINIEDALAATKTLLDG